MFEGFKLELIRLSKAELRVRHGGIGPALVLLHGHPRTHTTWHAVAPRLATDFTVVCPDLRGYGKSSTPPSTEDHAPYSKRAMADDIVELMAALGHERYGVVGHDRGSYVGMRLALDHPERVLRLTVMDGIPIGEALARADSGFASLWWHWFFLGQTVKPAEPLINRDPDSWYGGDPVAMGRANYEDYREAIHDQGTVHAMCEDYRAGLTVDRAADDADRQAGRRIGCPVQLLWAARDDMETLYGDPGEPWRDWTEHLETRRIESGHHMAEDAPGPVADALRSFHGSAFQGRARAT